MIPRDLSTSWSVMAQAWFILTLGTGIPLAWALLWMACSLTLCAVALDDDRPRR